MPACFLLGVNELVAVSHLVHPAAGWDEGDLANTIYAFVEQCFRQTDGFLKVASRRAVLDGDRLSIFHWDPFLS